MKIQEDYFYLLDNEKFVVIIWKKHNHACVMEIGTSYPSAIVGIERLNGIPLTEDWLLKMGYEWKNSGLRKGKICIRQFGGSFCIYLSNESYNFYIDLDYVHTFQNLILDLTKEELTINQQK